MSWLAGLSRRFWALPLLCAAAAVGLGLGLGALDQTLGTVTDLPLLFAGGPEGARSLLSAIVTSMISFTGLVFSITIVVLQLTSSQFSPRVLRTFLQDRVTQLSLGVFVATFVYALIVLRGVRGTADVGPFVPQLSVTLAFGFVLASVVVFLVFIAHIADSIRAATIISRIGDDTRELLERRREDETSPDGDAGQDSFDADGAALSPSRDDLVRRVEATGPGVVQIVDDSALADLAGRHRVTIRLLRAVGEFVPTGAPLIEVTGADLPSEDKLRRAVKLGTERSLDEDVGFGLRQLVDIAERALSPGINDPTTAVQVLDQLHDLLRRLADRPRSPQRTVRVDDRLAVVVPQPDFADLLGLAVDEIAFWGRDDDRVQHRLRVLLADLLDAAHPDHRPAVRAAWVRIHGDEDGLRDGDGSAATDAGLR